MIKIGIIGLGYWGPNYVRNLVGMDGVSVELICDQDSAALARIRKNYPFLKTTTASEQVLETKDLDAVIVATPAGAHFSLVSAALEADKHVLVEKPLALDPVQGRQLAKLATRKGKTLMVAYTFLYNAAVRKLKELVDSGELGDVYYLHAARTNLGPVRRDVNALWDLAPHDLSIFYYLLGKWPGQVSATGGTYLQDNVADVAFASLHYGAGVMGHFHVSWLDPRKVRQVTVVGSKKMALFDDLDSVSPVKLFDKGVMKNRFEKAYSSFEEFKIMTRDAGVIVPKVAQEEPVKVQCRHFIDCLREGRPPLSGAGLGSEMLYVLKALDQSLSHKGRLQRVALPARGPRSAVVS